MVFTWVQKMEGVTHLVDNFGFWDVFFHQARVRVHGILLQKKLKTQKMHACSSARTIACTFVNAGFFFFWNMLVSLVVRYVCLPGKPEHICVFMTVSTE